jgi:hypothetical protein
LIRKAFPTLAAFLFASIVFASNTAAADAQTTAPPTAFERQLDKLDLSIAGVGLYNSTVSGTVVSGLGASNQGEAMTQHASNTLGALISIHYPAKPYFGLEFNYSYGRYTENYTGPAISTFLPNGTTDFQVQTKVTEYTFGYLITPPYTIFGFQPFASVGGGPMSFVPTPRGGQEEPEKARMTYYYSLGLQKDLSPHFGVRGGFRELFFKDPDFGQNYLTILKQSTTYEPMLGFYIRY